MGVMVNLNLVFFWFILVQHRRSSETTRQQADCLLRRNPSVTLKVVCDAPLSLAQTSEVLIPGFAEPLWPVWSALCGPCQVETSLWWTDVDPQRPLPWLRVSAVHWSGTLLSWPILYHGLVNVVVMLRAQGRQPSSLSISAFFFFPPVRVSLSVPCNYRPAGREGTHDMVFVDVGCSAVSVSLPVVCLPLPLPPKAFQASSTHQPVTASRWSRLVSAFRFFSLVQFEGRSFEVDSNGGCWCLLVIAKMETSKFLMTQRMLNGVIAGMASRLKHTHPDDLWFFFLINISVSSMMLKALLHLMNHTTLQFSFTSTELHRLCCCTNRSGWLSLFLLKAKSPPKNYLYYETKLSSQIKSWCCTISAACANVRHEHCSSVAPEWPIRWIIAAFKLNF